jgi:aryl-alcohol dehydrogenase-like predicted oxidoreductase
MALAFVCGRSFVASALIGATNLDQLRENIGACSLGLAPELLEEIERIHLRYTNPAP